MASFYISRGLVILQTPPKRRTLVSAYSTCQGYPSIQHRAGDGAREVGAGGVGIGLAQMQEYKSELTNVRA